MRIALLRSLAILFLFALSWTGAAAQDVGTLQAEDYAAWEEVARRAETVIDSARASNASFEELRLGLTEWRARFRQGQEANAARLATLREQIAALGPVPADGAVEPPEIAARRAELNSRLVQAEAPSLTAQEAFQRADGLIREVDRIIAERQTEAMFEISPSPINPVNWWPTVAALASYGTKVIEEALAPFQTEVARQLLRDNLQSIAIYALLALVLLARSGRWLGRLQTRLQRSSTETPLVRVLVLLVGIARLALIVIGLLLVSEAVTLAGVSGLRIEALLAYLPVAGLIILAARWLGYQAFPTRETVVPLLTLGAERRVEGRLHAFTLGILFALNGVVAILKDTGETIAQYDSVLLFPLVVLTALVLLRLGQLFRLHTNTVLANTDAVTFLPRVVGLLGRAISIVAVAAVVLSAIGYVNATNAFLWPTVLSLGLIVLVSTLQSLTFDLYAMLTRRTEAVRDALVPTLIGFVLGLLTLPVFALIWGVRVATLTELWSAFLNGFSVGTTRISPTNFMTFAIVFAIGYMLTRLLQGVLTNSVLPKTKMDSGGQNAIRAGTGYLGVFLSAIAAITMAGIDLSGLAIVAGALSVGIGFGLQTIVSNFVSGIILLVERPIKLGDWITVGSVSGYVRDISVRSTRIETFDRQDVIVPNADLIAGVVTNYTLGNSTGRLIVPVGVAYGTDTRRVEKLLLGIAEAHPMVLLNPPPAVVFQGFGADSLNFEVRVLLRDVNFMLSVKSDMNHEIAKLFVQENIEIPFAQRDVWLRNPEALIPSSRPETPHD